MKRKIEITHNNDTADGIIRELAHYFVEHSGMDYYGDDPDIPLVFEYDYELQKKLEDAIKKIANQRKD